MNCKKLLLLAGLAFGYSGFSYGMDDEYQSFKDQLQNREWAYIVHEIQEGTARKLPQFIKLLVDSKDDLNTHNNSVKKRYLIDWLLVCYTDPTNDDQKRLNLRTTLKELIKHNKVDADLKGRNLVDFRLSGEDGQMALTMLQQVRQEIADEKSIGAAQSEEARRAIIKATFQKRCVIIGSVALSLGLAYALYRWYTQKVDKGAQEEDANLDDEHAVVDVQT